MAVISLGKLASAGRGLRRLGRYWRDPFEPGERSNILHTAHHKSGTVWLRRVLQAVARAWNLPFVDLAGASPGHRPQLYFQHRPLLDPQALAPLRGSHMIRDPRDIVVSGYHYHRWTSEDWANRPMMDVQGAEHRFAGVPAPWLRSSYRSYLNALPPEQGLVAEIRHVAFILREMADWNYHDPDILELRYEEAMRQPDATFERLFRHYGFTAAAVDEALMIARRFGFERVAGRAPGDVAERAHLRAGHPGQWAGIFTPEHRALFKELYGGLLIDLGYEDGWNW